MYTFYKLISVLIIFCVIYAFYYQFSVKLDYPLSKNPSDWVDFSDYIGGVLGTTFSFLSFIFLLHSLKLQNDANKELRNEAKANQKNEKFRHFESHFFNLLEAQRSSFDKFKFENNIQGVLTTCSGVEAVVELENVLEVMRELRFDDEDITDYLDEFDESEKIYNSIRIFNNILKLITLKLSDANGFTADDRKSQIETLITFTEFSLLRLVLISMQFMDLPSCDSIRANTEFINILEELGLEIDAY